MALTDFVFRLRSLFRRDAVEAEMDDELRFHFDQEVEKSIRAGLDREEALRRARLSFGGFDQVKEECRDARGVRTMENLFQDVRYALRMLWKSPGFTIVAMLTLALGIGANTAIFSVVYGVLLRPLPFPDAGRVMVLNETTPRVGTVSVSYPNFLDWRAQNQCFSKLSAVVSVAFNLAGNATVNAAGASQPESVNGEAVSTDFLAMMGVRPILGRDFDGSEEKQGAPPVTLLSYHLWQSHFAGDADVLGRTIAFDGRSVTVIGVLPADFRSVDKVDVMVPIGVWLTGNDGGAERGTRGDTVAVGRLKPGVSVTQARTEMDGIGARLATAYPATNERYGVQMQPIRDVFAGDIRPAILVLACAVMFVLLIACANVANLLLMRGAARTREIALRIALGAGRGRIVAQMLAESLVLASLGGVLGIVLAAELLRGIGILIPMDLLAGAPVTLDGMVLLFAGGIVLLSALIFGLVPAAQLTKPDVQAELKESGRSASATGKQLRVRDVLAVAEVAVALILLVGAGLMMKSFYRLRQVNPGFRPDRVLTMQLELRAAQYAKGPAALNFWQQALDRTRQLPGVESAALGTVIPMASEHSRGDVTIEGMETPTPGNFPHPDYHLVSPEFLSTLGIALLRGREFTDQDNENAALVGMINATLARRFFPDTDPIGKRFAFGHAPPGTSLKWITIVGVAGDTRLYGLENPARLEVYVPFRQRVPDHMHLLVKSAVAPAALMPSIRAAVAAIDKDQPIFGVVTMQELVSDSVSTSRVTLILLGVFGGLAVLLASIGIYGVISYSVAQRTHEIGVRMALGARRGAVLGMILGHGMKIAGAGVAIGVAAAFGLTRLMTKLLYAVSAADPLTFAGVAVTLLLVALLACYIPARRTLRVDPMIALRYE